MLRALAITKRDTLDWELYNVVFAQLTGMTSRQGEEMQLDAGDSSSEARGERDDAWVTATSERARKEGEKLDAEMRNYSINMIKESARQTLLAQARHQRACGDHAAAQRSFQKLRDFQSNAEYELETYLSTIEVALQDRQYNIVLPTVIKAHHALTRLASSVSSAAGGATAILTGEQVRERERRTRQVAQVTRETNVKLALAKGVALVATGQWEAGGKELVGLQDKLGDWEGAVSRGRSGSCDGADILGRSFRSVMSQCIPPCQRSRPCLVLSSSRPCWRTVRLGIAWIMARRRTLGTWSRRLSGQSIVECCGCSTSTRWVLSSTRRTPADIAQWRPLYDLHIQSQVTPLINTIRHRAYVQYFEPFQNVQLVRMAATFGIPAADAGAFERDVVDLIHAGKLQARLDDIEKVRLSTLCGVTGLTDAIGAVCR